METKERDLLEKKGRDYASDRDRLSNFKYLAEMLGLTPLQVWGVYCFKHLMALSQFVREGQVASEPIDERIADIRNYMILGQALIVEARETAHAQELCDLRTAEIEKRCEELQTLEDAMQSREELLSHPRTTTLIVDENLGEVVIEDQPVPHMFQKHKSAPSYHEKRETT
jgi:hypothetical protein